MNQPTYEELLADNLRLRAALAESQPTAPELGDLPDTEPGEPDRLVRVSAEGYEYRIYELEIQFMLAPAGEGQAIWDVCERVKANYLRDYPERPLNPKPHPDTRHDSPLPGYMGGPPHKEKKPRKTTKKAA